MHELSLYVAVFMMGAGAASVVAGLRAVRRGRYAAYARLVAWQGASCALSGLGMWIKATASELPGVVLMLLGAIGVVATGVTMLMNTDRLRQTP